MYTSTVLNEHGVYCYSFVRKHYPAQSDRVAIPPFRETDDTLRNMTVLPYLDDYHNPAPESEENEYDHYIRTHYRTLS